MTNDNIIREIDEELRGDRMRALWRRAGPFVIGAAVAVVIGVAANEGWGWWQASNQARSSDAYYEALRLAEAGDIAAAQTALDQVAAEGIGGYPALARFRAAALLLEQGDTAGAIAAYDALATSQSNPRLREVALVLAAFALVDAGDVGAVEQRVGGLAQPDSPMRNAAHEALGLVRYQAGDLDGAMRDFQAILDNPLTPQETRTRIQAFVAQLLAQGAAAPVPAADEMTDQPEDTSVAPSVGDAPELDVTAPEVAAPAATDAEPVQ